MTTWPTGSSCTLPACNSVCCRPWARRIRARRRAAADVPPFPYDSGAAALRAPFGEPSDPDASKAAALSKKPAQAPVRCIWLPTTKAGPVPSSPLIAETGGKGKGACAPWAVSVRVLDDREIVDLLGTCIGRRILAPSRMVGVDLAWWCHALRFAGTLVARQSYLPGIDDSGEACASRWIPILQPEDIATSAALAAAMPGAARAVSATRAAPPQGTAADLLRRFVQRMVDTLVRMDASSQLPAPAARSRRRAGRKAPFESLHEQWIHSLRSENPSMPGDAKELSRFAAQIDEWHRPVSMSAFSPFRFCFRLEEPEAEAEKPASRAPWHVRYLLQAADDRSLLIEAPAAWKPPKPVAALFRARAFEPRPYLLSVLGRAAGICPRIEESMRRPDPAGYPLDATGAHEFLTLRAQALEQAGFGVMLPSWWTRKGTKLRLAARARIKSPALKTSAGLSLDRILRFDIDLALAGEPITLQELESLAKLKAPLVKLRGQWVEVGTDEIATALEFWKRKSGGKAPVRDILRMALGGWTDRGGVPFEGVSADGWIADMIARLEGGKTLEEEAVPTGFRGELRPYQVRGYSWLAFLKRWGLGACLADDMGLGKTLQTLGLLLWLRREGTAHAPSLLVAPASLLANWKDEARRFAPSLRLLVVHPAGDDQERLQACADDPEAGLAEVDLAVTSYGMVARTPWLAQVPWRLVVLDEAQAIKNAATRQARAVKALQSRTRLALTGTPVENRAGDLWSLFDFINPGLLGDARRFGAYIRNRGDQPGAYAPLRRLTRPYILRRLKTDRRVIDDLPEKTVMPAYCGLTPAQAALYADHVRQLREALQKDDASFPLHQISECMAIFRDGGITIGFRYVLRKSLNQHRLGGFFADHIGHTRGKTETHFRRICGKSAKSDVFQQFRNRRYFRNIRRGGSLIINNRFTLIF